MDSSFKEIWISIQKNKMKFFLSLAFRMLGFRFIIFKKIQVILLMVCPTTWSIKYIGVLKREVWGLIVFFLEGRLFHSLKCRLFSINLFLEKTLKFKEETCSRGEYHSYLMYYSATMLIERKNSICFEAITLAYWPTYW